MVQGNAKSPTQENQKKTDDEKRKVSIMQSQRTIMSRRSYSVYTPDSELRDVERSECLCSNPANLETVWAGNPAGDAETIARQMLAT